MLETMKTWKRRTTTPLGRLVVIKILILSKVTHYATVLPSLNSKQIGKMHKAFCEFIWGNEHNKISRERMYNTFKEGCINYVDVEEFWGCLKMSWVRQAQTSTCTWAQLWEQELLDSNVVLKDLTHLEDLQLAQIAKASVNPFWRETLKVLAKIRLAFLKDDTTRVWKCSPFYNSLFKKAGKMPKKLGKTVTKHYTRDDLPKSEKHIKVLDDLRTVDDKYMSITQFKTKFGTTPQLTNCSGFRSTLVKARVTLNNDKPKDYYNSFHHFITCRKGTK